MGTFSYASSLGLVSTLAPRRENISSEMIGEEEISAFASDHVQSDLFILVKLMTQIDQ